MAVTIDPSTYAAAQQALQQQPSATGDTWSTISQFLNSKAGQAAIGAAGAGISAYGQSKTNTANREQQNTQFNQQLAQNAQEAQINDARARQLSTLQAQPQGSGLAFAQKQALLSAILPQLRNLSITPGDSAVAAAMPKINGGLRLPEGGLPQSVLDLYAPQATSASLGQYDQNLKTLNPQAAPTPYAAYGLPEPATPSVPNLGTTAPTTGTQAAPTRDALMRAIDGNIAAQAAQGTGGTYTKQLVANAIGAGGASAASPFTPSASPSVSNGQAAGAVARTKPTADVTAHGDPAWGTTYWEQMTNPAALASTTTNETGKAHDYYGGAQAPHVDQLTPQMQAAIKQNYGVSLKEDDVKKLAQRGWQYGMPAPDGYEYDRHTGLLQQHHGIGGKIVKIAAIAAPIAATVLTGGAASPWLYASIAGAAGAAGGAVDGGLKGALIGGALGAASGGLGAGSTGAIAKQTGTQVAKNVAEQAALGATGGLLQGGGAKGALLGAGFGAASAGASGLAGQAAPAAAPLAARVAAQSAAQAGVGALGGGTKGALMGAINGTTGQLFNSGATQTADKRRQLYSLMAQRAAPIYSAVTSQ